MIRDSPLLSSLAAIRFDLKLHDAHQSSSQTQRSSYFNESFPAASSETAHGDGSRGG